MVYARATRSGKDTISDAVRSCLMLILEYLEVARPRIVSFCSSLPPLILYTDSVVEEDIATAGTVLHVPGRPHQWYQLEVPAPVRQSWTESGTRHAVMQAELYPVV
eukprot:926807-Amphidinium_carterae.1